MLISSQHGWEVLRLVSLATDWVDGKRLRLAAFGVLLVVLSWREQLMLLCVSGHTQLIVAFLTDSVIIGRMLVGFAVGTITGVSPVFGAEIAKVRSSWSFIITMGLLNSTLDSRASQSHRCQPNE
jgi:MFS family permease